MPDQHCPTRDVIVAHLMLSHAQTPFADSVLKSSMPILGHLYTQLIEALRFWPKASWMPGDLNHHL